MKNTHKTKLSLLIASSLFLIGCDTEFSNPVGDTSTYSKGTANFSTYVAIGDSLTAGYADGTLYTIGQASSFPNILATQFKTVGGGNFRQPLMDDDIGGLKLGGFPMPDSGSSKPGNTRLVLNLKTQSPAPIDGVPSTELHPALNQNPLSGAFNNMGVPGAKSFHLLAPGYGALGGIFDVANNTPVSPVSANPYFIRFSTDDNASVLSDSLAQQSTFFTVWVGNNDVLAYAADGGFDTTSNTNATDHNENAPADLNNLFNPVNLANYKFSDITHSSIFSAYYTALVSQLVATSPNAKGILVSVPDIKTIPYFTTIPFSPIELDAPTAQFLTGLFTQYNSDLASSGASASEITQRTIQFSAGFNAPVIVDEFLTTNVTTFAKMRHATATDILTLPAKAAITPASQGGLGLGNNPATPLTDEYVLTPNEIAAIDNATASYNATIKSLADNNDNLAFYDASAFMSELKTNGIDYGTGSITSSYATGGAFSLDGIHPTARGYAVVANGLIDTINSSFGANIPKVDPGTYTTIFSK